MQKNSLKNDVKSLMNSPVELELNLESAKLNSDYDVVDIRPTPPLSSPIEEIQLQNEKENLVEMDMNEEQNTLAREPFVSDQLELPVNPVLEETTRTPPEPQLIKGLVFNEKLENFVSAKKSSSSSDKKDKK